MLKPYYICKGRKFKKEKLKKLIRPISCKKKSVISNYNINDKDKIRFITQIFRWFKKDSRHYKLNYFFKNKYIISNCDYIDLSVKIQKAGWKKLLFKLNYFLKDYKELKRRSYTLNFRFFFLINNLNEKKKEITLDINAETFDTFFIFITTINTFYIEDFYYIINKLNRKMLIKKDENDYMLEDLKYIFSWNRLNKVICYDVFMPWYVTKEEYYTQKQFKRKSERKYHCTIIEKRFNSIFPLKNIIGHLIVADNKNINKDDISFWKTLLKNNNFNRKEDLFKELKILINRINKMYKLNSVLVYIFLENLDK